MRHLGEYINDLTYAAGYDPVTSQPDQALIDQAVALAQNAEVAVVLCRPTRHF